MYPGKGRRATYRVILSPLLGVSGEFELCVAFDEFFRAAAGKTHGDAPVFVVAFHSDHGSCAISRMADFSSEHWIGVCATLQRRTRE